MIELPESYNLAKQFNETVTKKKVRSVEAGYSPHRFAFFFGSPEYYSHLLVGKILDKAEAISGQLELYFQDVRFVFNDGITFHYLEEKDKRPAKHQLLMEFCDGSGIACTVRMYGGLHAFFDGENDNSYYLVAKEKPSPLMECFDESYFDKLWKEAKPTLSVKAFLATEQRIPGLGNGVLQDILFHAGVNPKSRLEKLSETEMRAVYESVRGTIREMALRGGRDTEKDLFGASGGYACVLSKNTLLQPCPVCGGAIVREAYLGGNIYYCPVCQPIKK